MKNLFLDSNIWLSLYNFSNDDLEQFEKLEDLINKDIRLFIPEQTRDEVMRNRENRIKDALSSFELSSTMFPAFSKGYSEYEDISIRYRVLKNDFAVWKNKINKDINNQCLPADIVINRFFVNDRIIPSKDFADQAELRYKLGNPPGKNNSYGDAINWECLLNKVPDNEDLYFVGNDKDYRSVIDNKRFNSFLVDEWNKRKGSNIIFYSELTSFLKEHISEVQLKEAEEKAELIKALNDSGNFANTHAIIASLQKHTFYSNEEIEKICDAAENNNQVAWIIHDPDVTLFYRGLLSATRQEEYDPNSSVHRIFEIVSDSDN